MKGEAKRKARQSERRNEITFRIEFWLFGPKFRQEEHFKSKNSLIGSLDRILEKQIPLKFGWPVLPHLDRASLKSWIFANFDKYDQNQTKIQI